MSHSDEKQQLWIILLIVFISYIGTSVAYPIFPPYFLHPLPGSIVSMEWGESARSILLGIALAVYPFGQFIGSPILGGCSDRYGRKRVLMWSLVGSTIGYLLTAISLQFNWLWALLASRFITGMMEGNFAIVRAMAADLESISKYKSLGRISGVCAIGYVMGPLLGGFLSDSKIVTWFSFAFPFYFAMLFSFLSVVLSYLKLVDNTKEISHEGIHLWQRFNLVKRMKELIQNNVALKHLLIVSTCFTFAVDIFYEFGPVYLTGLWAMTPAGIAIYNIALSSSLAFGASWLPHYFSKYFTVRQVMLAGMLLTAIIYGLLVIFPYQIFAFILFGLIGLSISIVTTNMVIEVSNVADKTIQGEAMGTQLSLRMLGDGIICLVGGFLIVSSVTLPIVLSAVIALIAAMVYAKIPSRQTANGGH